MKLNRLFILTAIFSLSLLSCEKDNELTPNPAFDPEASNTNSGENGGTIVSQGLAGNFGGTSVTINDCFFEIDTMFSITSIEARSIDSSKTVNFVIFEIITSPKTYTPSDAITNLSYDFDATDDSTDTEYIAIDGSLKITSVSGGEIKGTFSFNSVAINDFTKTESVTGGSFTAEKK